MSDSDIKQLYENIENADKLQILLNDQRAVTKALKELAELPGVYSLKFHANSDVQVPTYARVGLRDLIMDWLNNELSGIDHRILHAKIEL